MVETSRKTALARTLTLEGLPIRSAKWSCTNSGCSPAKLKHFFFEIHDVMITHGYYSQLEEEESVAGEISFNDAPSFQDFNTFLRGQYAFWGRWPRWVGTRMGFPVEAHGHGQHQSEGSLDSRRRHFVMYVHIYVSTLSLSFTNQ